MESREEMDHILASTKYVTLAMCRDNRPYLVTLSHGYDRPNKCLYFHCAPEGKKIDILKERGHVYGQAMMDMGYVQGRCDHLFATVHFEGSVDFLETHEAKRHALEVMIRQLEDNPDPVIKEQVTDRSVSRVTIGRIRLHSLVGKKSSTPQISS